MFGLKKIMADINALQASHKKMYNEITDAEIRIYMLENQVKCFSQPKEKKKPGRKPKADAVRKS